MVRHLYPTLLLGLLLPTAGLLPPALAQTPAPPPAAQPATPTALRRAMAPPQPDSLRAVLLVRYGLNHQSDNLDTAIAYVRRGLQVLRRSGPPRQEAHALEMLGGLYFQANRLRQAQALFEQGLARFRQLNNPAGMVSCYGDLGNVAATLGNRPLARHYFEQARQLGPRLPPAEQFRLGIIYYNLAGIYGELGQPARSAQLLRQAFAVNLRTEHPQMQPAILLELGNLALAAHRPDSARLLMRQGLAAVEPPYSGPDEASQLHAGLARVALAAQRPAQALPEARLALRQAQQVGSPDTQADALLTIAQAQQALHQPGAYATLAQYLALHDTLTNRAQAQAVITAQARFQAREQQAQIRTLQQDRRLAAQAQELTRLRTRYQLAGLGGGAVLLLLLGGILFQRYRQRQAAARAAAAAALRQRLAADLHDDVGNLLTQISLQSGLLRESPLLPAPLLARVDALTSTARRATQQMSDAIWGLAATAPTLPDLLRHMRDHAHEVLQPLGLEPRFDTHPAVPALPLSAEARQALYLIFKEALHNIVKHARPSEVVITLAPAPGHGLALTVCNDGPAAALPARPEGQGLASMQARAAAVGGRVQFPVQAVGFVVEAVV